MKQRYDIGVLFSRSGDYALLSGAAREGVLAGLEMVNRDPGRRIELVPIEMDPAGRAERYGRLCADMLRGSTARHIVGCTTSWSRKEAIPELERHDGLLWYCAPYEGFEANEHVVYMHACPNQHIVPLLAYALPRFGTNAFLVGSNYVWGWEVNRVARDLVGDAGGTVSGERYIAIGDTDVARLIAEIQITRPSFILNNLIGPSSYAFIEALGALAREDGRFAAARCPVLSCNLTECELPALGGAADGNLVVGPYFGRPGGHGPASSFTAAAQSAIIMLATLIEKAGTDDPRQVGALLASAVFETPMGRIAIDPQNQHAHLPVIIGTIAGNAVIPVWQTDGAVAPDPYLSRYDPRTAFGRSQLRVVS